MSQSRAPRGPQPTLGNGDTAFRPLSDRGSPHSPPVDVSEPPPSTVRQGVVKALSVRLKETYRKANPSRPGCDAAPRRVLTHPSFPVANG